jgi:hypothetical protein
MHFSSSHLFLLGPALMLLSSHASGGVRYVDASLATGANDGSSWPNAFQSADGLQSALAAAVAGDQIWVAQGSYRASATQNISISFRMKNGVELYGGFAGGETLLTQRNVATNVTILDGDLIGHFSTHVVAAMAADATAVLDGFTVRGGRSSSSTGGSDGSGGGLFCQGGAGPTVRNCIFRNNSCTASGGAVYIESSGPAFLDTRFENNFATGFITSGTVIPGAGGAVSMLSGNNNNMVLARCQFLSNSAAVGGGVATGGGNPTITNCVFWNNTSSANSGGTSGGGALSIGTNATIRNCTIVGNNSITGAAGGILVWNSASIANCIVYFNQGSGGAMGLVNNLSGASATYSCVQGGLAGTGNISSDPLLVNLAGGDVRLTSNSPCADAGSNALVPAGTTTDLYGNARFADDAIVADTGEGDIPIVDMGAHEVPNTLYASFCAGDGSLATACPCGNNGLPGRGCRNSDIPSGGGLLSASGTASPDTVVLNATHMLPTVSCVFLQGTATNSSGVVFGDGVRCVAGTLKRLYVHTASGSAASAPVGADLSISARSAALGDPIHPGELRYYQVYYRDPDPTFCPNPPGNTWNVTAGVIVQW